MKMGLNFKNRFLSVIVSSSITQCPLVQCHSSGMVSDAHTRPQGFDSCLCQYVFISRTQVVILEIVEKFQSTALQNLRCLSDFTVYFQSILQNARTAGTMVGLGGGSIMPAQYQGPRFFIIACQLVSSLSIQNACTALSSDRFLRLIHCRCNLNLHCKCNVNFFLRLFYSFQPYRPNYRKGFCQKIL